MTKVVSRIECNIMEEENTCTNRMRYAQKVRLALALLIVKVTRVVKVLWRNLDALIYRNTNKRKETNKQQGKQISAMHTHDDMFKLCTYMVSNMTHKLNEVPRIIIAIIGINLIC